MITSCRIQSLEAAIQDAIGEGWQVTHLTIRDRKKPSFDWVAERRVRMTLMPDIEVSQLADAGGTWSNGKLERCWIRLKGWGAEILGGDEGDTGEVLIDGAKC